MEATPEVIEATNKLVDAATVKPSAKQILLIYGLIGLLAVLISIGTLIIMPPLGLILLASLALIIVYFFNKEMRKKILEAENEKIMKLSNDHQKVWEKNREKEAKLRAEWTRADLNAAFAKQKQSKKRKPSLSTLDDSMTEISNILEYGKKKEKEEQERYQPNNFFIESSPSCIIDYGLPGSKIKRRINIGLTSDNVGVKHYYSLSYDDQDKSSSSSSSLSSASSARSSSSKSSNSEETLD